MRPIFVYSLMKLSLRFITLTEFMQRYFRVIWRSSVLSRRSLLWFFLIGKVLLLFVFLESGFGPSLFILDFLLLLRREVVDDAKVLSDLLAGLQSYLGRNFGASELFKGNDVKVDTCLNELE